MAIGQKGADQPLPTQQFIEVDHVRDGVAVLKNGGLRQILLVSGINFDLKSEEEQEAVTFAYQNFLNSLDFPLQIFIHSRKLNIGKYIENLSQLELKEQNPLLRNQIAEYREFIRSFVTQNAIMDKKFFAVIPFDPVRLPAAATATTKRLFGFLSKSKTTPATAPTIEDASYQQYVGQLNQRTDQIITGLNQIGLRAVALNDEEITELLYNLYNPGTTEKEGIGLTQQAGS